MLCRRKQILLLLSFLYSFSITKFTNLQKGHARTDTRIQYNSPVAGGIVLDRTAPHLLQNIKTYSTKNVK